MQNESKQTRSPLVRVHQLTKSYPTPEGGGVFTVLDSIDLSVYPHEIVALLGRSGSGKSTLLRTIAGLIPPSSGTVEISGQKLAGVNPDSALVFQTFALLPWLTVQENVEVALETKKTPHDSIKKLVQDALKLVGLDGYANAYPRELSGGMQQRVGFARAMVARPKVMLLDEPFSMLDVLTAENLRGEVDDLWQAGAFPATSILMVTNNIEEAILLADRVVVLGANPSRVRGEIPIKLPRPRRRSSQPFRSLADHIYTIMTNPESEIRALGFAKAPAFRALPEAAPGPLSGLLELLHEYGGKEDVSALSARLLVEADDLLPLVDAAKLLGFAGVESGDLTLTDLGRRFAMGSLDDARAIFREATLAHAPLVRAISDSLLTSTSGEVEAEDFLDELQETFGEEEALVQFNVAVNWGRHAGLFDYDADEEVLTIIGKNDD